MASIHSMLRGFVMSGALALGACQTTQVAAPVAAPLGASSIADVRNVINPKQPFAVNVAGPENQPLLQGEAAAFKLDSQRDGFAQLYLLRASGGVLLLAENLPVKARDLRRFPNKSDGFELKAQRPPGVDVAVLVVTAQPFASGLGPAARPAKPQPVLSPLGRDAFVERLGSALKQLHPDDWNGAMTTVEVLARK